MSFARRGFRFLLAAPLIFSQQQAGLHLLGYGLAQLSAASAGLDPQRESNDPQELVCAKCLAVAHPDHAVSGTVPAFAPVVSTPAVPHQRRRDPGGDLRLRQSLDTRFADRSTS